MVYSIMSCVSAPEWSSHEEIFVRSLRQPIIFTPQDGHPVRHWTVELSIVKDVIFSSLFVFELKAYFNISILELHNIRPRTVQNVYQNPW